MLPPCHIERKSLPTDGQLDLSFYRSSGRATDPPLTSIVAMAAARHNGAQLVNWIRYIYPETAVELGVPFMRGPFTAKPDGVGFVATRD